MSIPGLFSTLSSMSFDSSSCEVNENITLTGFDLKTFIVPGAHRYGKCQPVSDFDKIGKYGEGTFGSVYKVRDKHTNKIVALKKLKIPKESECMPLNFTREINILKVLKHENIVQLYGIAVGKSIESTFLILEHCSYVLSNIIDEIETVILPQPQVKCIMHQLFTGLDYIHKHFFLHRDLNATNILFTSTGVLKISDFGCSCKASSGDLTPDIVSRWYRPPEILFGSTRYSYSVDIWSSGCVFAELLLRKPLFKGDSDADVIRKIVDCLSTPNESNWPGFSDLPLLKSYNLWPQPVNRLFSYFDAQSPTCFSLIQKLFVYNPEDRYTAAECLDHGFFTESPVACSPASLATTLMVFSNEI